MPIIIMVSIMSYVITDLISNYYCLLLFYIVESWKKVLVWQVHKLNHHDVKWENIIQNVGFLR